MNICNMLKKLTFGCGLATLCFSFQASAYSGDDCCNPCCQPTCCEDGPLSCNAFGVQVKGGVTPSWFTDRGNILISHSVHPFIVEGPKEPDFNKLFDLPWQVGAELQWNASTHVQFFAEYVYENAKGKKHHFRFDDTFSFRHNNRNFVTNSAYLGARYYFGSLWCSECGTSSIAPFVGLKGGVVWHERTKNRFHLLCGNTEWDCGSHDSFKQQTLISAGAQIGLDWSINCNLGAVFTVEVVGTQGLRNNRNVVLPLEPLLVAGTIIPTNLNRGETGHILSVPVTLGLRYTF